ncbi:hypothetical protein ASF78_01935 [Cellulomonas sp. Leaf334]|nr:hypothetical protein ASF78_01935 [Cellulomonas sp. Leaf334]
MAPIGVVPGPWGANEVGCAGAAYVGGPDGPGWYAAEGAAGACAWYGGGLGGACGALLCDGIGENIAGAPACGPTGR